jgi:hypothetical protein
VLVSIVFQSSESPIQLKIESDLVAQQPDCDHNSDACQEGFDMAKRWDERKAKRASLVRNYTEQE